MSDYRYEHQPSNNNSSRRHYGYPPKPTGITIHHWGSTGQKRSLMLPTIYVWRNGNTSAHYVTSAGLVTQLVDESRAAWHAGSTPGNGSTIGIECRPEMSADDWATLVELCTDIEDRNGSMKYYKHSDWKNTACPGDYSDRIGELVEAVNAEHDRRKTGAAKPTPAKPSKPSAPTGNLTVDGNGGKTRHGNYRPNSVPPLTAKCHISPSPIRTITPVCSPVGTGSKTALVQRDRSPAEEARRDPGRAYRPGHDQGTTAEAREYRRRRQGFEPVANGQGATAQPQCRESFP